MKKILSVYLISILLYIIPYLLTAFILSVISYFIQINSLSLTIIIHFISYLCLIISALYCTTVIKKKRLIHCFIMGFIYFILCFIIHTHIKSIHMIIKPFVYIIIGLIKIKKQD